MHRNPAHGSNAYIALTLSSFQMLNSHPQTTLGAWTLLYPLTLITWTLLYPLTLITWTLLYPLTLITWTLLYPLTLMLGRYFIIDPHYLDSTLSIDPHAWTLLYPLTLMLGLYTLSINPHYLDATLSIDPLAWTHWLHTVRILISEVSLETSIYVLKLWSH